jgi:hypothetical protein
MGVQLPCTLETGGGGCSQSAPVKLLPRNLKTRRSNTIRLFPCTLEIILKQLLCRNVKRFRGVLVVNAHRLVYYSTLGPGGIKKKKTLETGKGVWSQPLQDD